MAAFELSTPEVALAPARDFEVSVGPVFNAVDVVLAAADVAGGSTFALRRSLSCLASVPAFFIDLIDIACCWQWIMYFNLFKIF